MARITNMGTEPVTLAIETRAKVAVTARSMIRVSTQTTKDVVVLEPGCTVITDYDFLVDKGRIGEYSTEEEPPQTINNEIGNT